MNAIGELRDRVRRESFQPTALSTIFAPTYIIRRGLFLAIKALGSTLSGKILDFGCGSKPYESLFPCATSYIGVDLVDTGHDHCDSRVDVFYDGKALPFENGDFDGVVSFEVFEHVFNLPDVLKEINRVTKDSGYLLISIPFAWPEHEQPYDFARYTSFGIVRLLKDVGYEVIETRKTTTYLLAVFQLFIAYLTQVAPKNRFIRYLRQIGIIFPCILVAYALNEILPRRYEYYCNAVVLARKISSFESTSVNLGK
jgi:SAM-dependent methyltransferase